jgi:hypothetical protein
LEQDGRRPQRLFRFDGIETGLQLLDLTRFMPVGEVTLIA